MSVILKNIVEGFAAASLLDLANLLLGVTGVWLMIRRSLWAFPIGLVAVTVQGILFYKARFYADASLQVFFFACLAWGWRHWVRDKGNSPELPITVLSWRMRVLVLVATGGCTVVWALALREWTNAVMPFRDAFIASFSIAAQILQVRKHVENWVLWLAVNLTAIVSYWSAELAFTAFLYLIYLALGLSGWIGWQRAYGKQQVARREGARDA